MLVVIINQSRLPSSLAASTLWKGDKPKRYRLGFIILHHDCNFLSVLKNFRYTTQAAKWWLKLKKKKREFLSHIWTQLIEKKKIHLRLTTMFFLASISQKWKHHIYCDMSSSSFEILQNLSILLCTPLQSLLFWNGPWQTPLDLVHTHRYHYTVAAFTLSILLFTIAKRCIYRSYHINTYMKLHNW